MTIRLAIPDIDDTDVEAVAAVLRTGMLVQGTHVRAFEQRVAFLAGASHAVAVANCTAALHLALIALRIGEGHAVAVATYSWPATANVIALVGARPVFVDIDPGTFNMDPAALARALDRERSIHAIMPVHTFGGMADMTRITNIAMDRGIPVIEDAACALGARLAGRAAGGWGRLGCFSFHPRKAVTTGEGGAITTDDESLDRRLRALRNHGQDPYATFPDFIEPGFNLRLTDFQGSLGVSQLAKLDRVIAARRERAARYDVLLHDTPVRAPQALAPEAHVYQSYVVLLPAGCERDEVVGHLRAAGIEATIGTHHMPLITHFRQSGGYRTGDFPITDDVAARALSLPLHTQLDEETQSRVVESLLRAIGA